MDGHLFPEGFFLLGLVIFTLVLLSLIVMQYATRKTRSLRNSLIALPALLLILGLVAPTESLIRHTYPALASSATPQWIFDASPARRPARQQTSTGRLPGEEDLLVLKLPVTQLNSPPGERFKVDAIAASIDAPGYHWSSSFLASNNLDLSDTQRTPTVKVTLPRDVFERVRTIPVDLHLQFASTISGTDAASQGRALLPTFHVPRHGLCPLDAEGTVGNCRYAFRLATPIDITAHVSSRPCDRDQTQGEDQPAMPILTTFIGSDDDRLAFDFDPVATTTLNLVLPGSTYNQPLPAFLCSESPLTFTSHSILRRGSFVVDARHLLLGEYAEQ